MRLLLICAGGALGTGARYLAGGLAERWLGADFPYGTLFVNVLGSLLIGVVQSLAIAVPLSETTRVAWVVGVLGGFTTYSSFSYETVRLIERGSWVLGAANVALTTALCLAACAAGLALGRAGVR